MASDKNSGDRPAFITNSNQKTNISFRKLDFAEQVKNSEKQVSQGVQKLCNFFGFGEPVKPVKERGSNTSLDSQPIRDNRFSVHIDYISGILLLDDEKTLLSVCRDIEKTFGLKGSHEDFPITIGCYKFQKRFFCPAGVRLHWIKEKDSRFYRCHLSISGTPLSSIPVLAVLQFLDRLRLKHFSCTRIDIAIDDHSCGVPIKLVKQALDNGNYALFKKYDYRTYKNLFRDDAGNWKEIITETVYCGANKKKLRIYDAEPVHGITAIRFEGQFREEYAKSIFAALSPVEKFSGGFWSDSPQQTIFSEAKIASHLANIVISGFDFIYKKDKNLARNTRLSWWSEFRRAVGLGKFFFAIPKAIKTFQKTINWIDHSVGKSLTLLYLGLGGEFTEYLECLVAHHLKKFKKQDENLFEQLKLELDKESLVIRGLFPRPVVVNNYLD